MFFGIESLLEKTISKQILLYSFIAIIGVLLFGLAGSMFINENAIAQVNYNNNKLIEISKENISIYVRSIFLQGLLLMSANEVPHFFAPVSNVFKNFENFCNLMSISKFQCCIEYVKSLNWSSGIVAGISNLGEYEKLISEIYSPQKNIEIPFFEMNQFYSDPRNWR
jgi:hypothetical protein